jgi:hypothetical protein
VPGAGAGLAGSVPVRELRPGDAVAAALA